MKSQFRIIALPKSPRRNLTIPEQTVTGLSFSDRDLARARFIQNLKDDFGVNDEGIDVVLHLVDQLHGMRRALAQLHKDMGDASA